MREHPIKVLCVEDDDLDRMIIKRAVKSSGLNIDLVFAEDMESGKELTDNAEYDCIFLDYSLPDGSGVELLKYIRASGNTSPIIIVTSQGDEKIAVEVMKNGAQDYIPKNLLSAEGLSQSLRFVMKMKENELEKQRIENELRNTQKKLQTVISHSPIIFFLLDENGVFSLFDGKGAHELPVTEKDIIGKKIKDLPEGMPMAECDFFEAMQGNEKTVIYELHNKYYEVFYSPKRNETNTVVGVIGIASDITSHKLAEKELTKAKQLAEETARMKEQFLANMSHEIRTPMNGITGLTNILLNTKMDNEQMKYLKSVKTCSDNLLVIINDILDLSKIESGKMTFEKVAFRMEEIVKHTWELFSAKASEKNISLQYNIDKNIPSFVGGDPTRLSQILNNLVSNAIKFTDTGGVTIDLNLKSSREENITINFCVTDTGIGIPEKSFANIFESFTQASSDTTRKFGGTGLGLTIVKKLVELQGGTISVRSKPRAGTTFCFHLTFNRVNEKELASSAYQHEDCDISHLNILIAEDNEINQMIVKKLFADWKTKTEFADNGAIAIDKLVNGNFDLILMDIQMPEMDGYAATKKIRQELMDPFRSIPIMAMTAHATPSEKQKSYDCGMNDYISKPFEPYDLKRKILELTLSEKSGIKNEGTSGKPDTVISHQENTSVVTVTEPINTSQNNTTANNACSDMKIDLAYLKQVSGNNPEFIIQMIEMFLQKTPDALEEMNEKFKKQSWEELRNVAHRIKPSYTYVGLGEIQKLLAEIERCSQSQTNLEKLPNLIGQVESQSKEAFIALQKELVQMK